jgi:hypothetical protein
MVEKTDTQASYTAVHLQPLGQHLFTDGPYGPTHMN